MSQRGSKNFLKTNKDCPFKLQQCQVDVCSEQQVRIEMGHGDQQYKFGYSQRTDKDNKNEHVYQRKRKNQIE